MKAVLKNIDVRGSTMGSLTEFHAMVDFVREKKIRPVIAGVVKGIDNVADIDALFTELGRGSQFGKLVVKIGSGESVASKI